MIALFILIYLISLVTHIVLCYTENKYAIYKVGDLIDLIEFYMWCPIINTLLLMIFVTDILWEKFRNIKLK